MDFQYNLQISVSCTKNVETVATCLPSTSMTAVMAFAKNSRIVVVGVMKIVLNLNKTVSNIALMLKVIKYISNEL